MKRTSIILLALFLFTSLLVSENFSSGKIITEQLQNKIASSNRNDFIRVNIVLNEQYPSNELMRAVRNLSKTERRAYVINELKNFSNTTQADLLSQLNGFENNKLVKEIKPLWITNLINCYATKDVIEQLAQRDDIKSIDWDETRNMLIDGAKSDNAKAFDSSAKKNGGSASREITWNVTKVNADDVWSLGYTGSGVIVAVIDTGVNYNHHDLADHMWTDPSYPNHGYDFNANDNDPMDEHGHGTHCSGTVAGDGTSGSQTGMAPDANIMALRVLDSNGSGNESDVWDAIQFAVDHGANIMSMSIGWRHSYSPDRASWRNSLNNALAAGLVSSVAAGNDGEAQSSYPIPDNVGTPGDCPPPWLNPDQTLTGLKKHGMLTEN